MEYYRYLYIAAYVISLIFLFNRRKILDLFTVNIIISLLYFGCGLFGTVRVPNSYDKIISNQIENELYGIFALIIFTQLVTIYIFDKTNRNIKYVKLESVNLNGYYTSTSILLIFGLSASIFTLGNILIQGDKFEMLMELKGDRTRVLWTYTFVILLAISTVYKNKIFILLPAAAMLMHLYIGHRSLVFVAIVSYIVIQYNNKKTIKYKYYIIGVLFLLAIFIYKGIYYDIKSLDFEIAYEKLINLQFYIDRIYNYESFTTQGIFNEVLRYNIESDRIKVYDTRHGREPPIQTFADWIMDKGDNWVFREKGGVSSSDRRGVEYNTAWMETERWYNNKKWIINN